MLRQAPEGRVGSFRGGRRRRRRRCSDRLWSMRCWCSLPWLPSYGDSARPNGSAYAVRHVDDLVRSLARSPQGQTRDFAGAAPELLAGGFDSPEPLFRGGVPGLVDGQVCVGIVVMVHVVWVPPSG